VNHLCVLREIFLRKFCFGIIFIAAYLALSSPWNNPLARSMIRRFDDDSPSKFACGERIEIEASAKIISRLYSRFGPHENVPFRYIARMGNELTKISSKLKMNNEFFVWHVDLIVSWKYMLYRRNRRIKHRYIFNR